MDLQAPKTRLRLVFSTFPFVLGAWVAIFVWQPLNFWLLLGSAQATLIVVSLALAPELKQQLRPRAMDVLIGLASAVVLYGIFLLGHEVSTRILPFAAAQIGDVYTIRDQAHAIAIGLLLLLVIGPGEELYWRGLVQRTFMGHWGAGLGVAVALLVYALVHTVAGNFMLLVAATVGGAFWGLLYWWRRSLPANIVSHAVWDVLILVLFPIT